MHLYYIKLLRDRVLCGGHWSAIVQHFTLRMLLGILFHNVQLIFISHSGAVETIAHSVVHRRSEMLTSIIMDETTDASMAE